MTVPGGTAWFPLGGQGTAAHSSSAGPGCLQQQAATNALQAAHQPVNVSSMVNVDPWVTFASTGVIGSAYASSTHTVGQAYAHSSAITTPSTEATTRSMELLYDWMNEDQRRQWATRSCFDVIGGNSGRRYRIYPPMPFNVHRLSKDSEEPDWKICFEPKDKKLPKGDILLCQKLALELDEEATLEIANQQVYHAW